ncbi:hypothetical protein OS493_007139 [Desmophyllum pertusum]|uniref:Uncharacterized protein n=1 Tax=Desmophyllum pertusum TaxID=174260 RepID=A0A9W9ZFJ6_9CNID|nr:hypothetical protein OS493_007139 [Desmophyllum pertusum]
MAANKSVEAQKTLVQTEVYFKGNWKNTAEHQTKAGSNLSRHDLAKWAKRPFPEEEIFIVGEAYSVLSEWNEGALLSAYNEGWEIEQPEHY